MKYQKHDRAGQRGIVECMEARILLTAPLFTFSRQIDFSGGAEVRSADLNGDGKNDFLVGTDVFLNNGDGSFKQLPAFGTGKYAGYTFADVNGDGIPDIVAIDWDAYHQTTALQIGVLIGNGNGTFKPEVTYATPDYPSSITVADITGGGVADIICTYIRDNAVGIRLGKGDGTFQPESALVHLSAPFDSVVASDVNGDGKADLIIGYSGGDISVLLSNGDGSFQLPIPTAVGNYYLSAVADINGDGKPDIVATENVGSQNGNTLYFEGVFLGNGDGTFQSFQSVAFGYTIPQILIADINGDGHPDLIESAGSFGVSAILGNGDGTFQPAVSLDVSAAPDAFLTLADLNNDGLPDIIDNAPGAEIDLNTTAATPLLSFSTANGILTATANGNHPDDILLSRTGGIISLSDSGDVTTYQASSLKQININTGLGKDVVTIEPGIGIPVSVNGGQGRDTLIGDGPNITLAGGKGNDSITAFGHDNLLIGGVGNDTLLAGATPTDTLQGGAGDDSLTGGGLLIGGIGDDTIVKG